MVQRINEFEPQMQQLSDTDFPVRIAQYRQQVQDGEKTLDALLPEVFALVREASRRKLGMQCLPYGVKNRCTSADPIAQEVSRAAPKCGKKRIVRC